MDNQTKIDALKAFVATKGLPFSKIQLACDKQFYNFVTEEKKTKLANSWEAKLVIVLDNSDFSKEILSECRTFNITVCYTSYINDEFKEISPYKEKETYTSRRKSGKIVLKERKLERVFVMKLKIGGVL